ncbi:hypothetical protein JX266_013676 [Neoarthrinium moseri]|nr:hypothetical protein JX266_013676 [Neoarthrinium moseri]
MVSEVKAARAPIHGDSVCATNIGTQPGYEQPIMELESHRPQEFERGPRFWVIIIGLGISTLLASLEHTVVTTSAPRILEELQMREDFIWVTNAFFVSRWVFLLIIALFTLGSGVCGGATSGGMLIAGRAIQGAGSGGIVLTVNIIVSDLVPLRNRGTYMAIILAIFGIGIAVGPFIGGAIAEATTWRWVFFINLPIGGTSLVTMFFFLRLKHDDKSAFMQRIKRIDFIGNGLLMASTVAVLYALAYAGAVYPWSSWNTLVPLLLGFLGCIVFVGFELSSLPAEPVMPVRLFAHRTSIIVLINTFLNSTLYFWYLFFLPVYFQAVSLYSPFRAGYSLIPQAVAGIPGAAISAASLSRWGRFKALQFAGFAATTMGMGLLSMLWEGTSVAEWATFQCIAALGIGIVIDALLPAFQAPLDEADQAAATSAWGFIRAFGSIWGVAIPAVIFNNRIDEMLKTISAPTARKLLASGGAYQQASAAFVMQFPQSVQDEIRAAYREALQRVFWIGAIFAGLATVLVLIERDVTLRKVIDTEFGLEDGRKSTHEATAGRKV